MPGVALKREIDMERARADCRSHGRDYYPEEFVIGNHARKRERGFAVPSTQDASTMCAHAEEMSRRASGARSAQLGRQMVPYSSPGKDPTPIAQQRRLERAIHEYSDLQQWSQFHVPTRAT